MEKVIVLSFGCFLVLSLHAQTASIATNTTSTHSTKNTLIQPSTPVEDVLVLKETEYDFGKIPQGKPVTHVFDVVNNGKDSLKIINVQASCGCTTPDWEKNKVQAPGEKTKINVGYNAASEGAFTKVITITYNGSLTKQIIIKGDVWKTPSTSAPENKELGSLQNQ